MIDITAASYAQPARNDSTASPVGQMPNQQFNTDLFLQLLVTQLRYQDPMSGSQDTGEMITQLSMFTLLEQVVQIQAAVEKQALVQDRQQALSLLNRQVEVYSPDGEIVGGTVSAVEFTGAGAQLTIGDRDYPLSSLIRVEGVSTEDGQ